GRGAGLSFKAGGACEDGVGMVGEHAPEGLQGRSDVAGTHDEFRTGGSNAFYVLGHVSPRREKWALVQLLAAAESAEEVRHDLVDDLPPVAHEGLVLLGRDRLRSARANVGAGDLLRAHPVPWVKAK